MHASAWRGLLAAAALAATLPATAAEGLSGQCELPAGAIDPLAERAAVLAQYEQLPRACLDEIFTACTVAASQSLLDLGTAAACSFGYEALLKQGFGGNFRALIAWWRAQRPPALQ